MEPIIKQKSSAGSGANVAIPLTPGAAKRIEVDDATKEKSKDRWKHRDPEEWDAVDTENAKDAMLEEEAANEEEEAITLRVGADFQGLAFKNKLKPKRKRNRD